MNDRFANAYSRGVLTFGDVPSQELLAFLRRHPRSGEALDLGCGLGRDTIALAECGLRVMAVDTSEVAMARLRGFASRSGLTRLIQPIVADFRELEIEPRRFSVISAATSLDHIPRRDFEAILPGIVKGLAAEAVLFIEVHTTDDPGFSRTGPVSEFADVVQHYFRPGELFQACDGLTRIVRYEEKLEWDDTHGERHLHGFATLLASSTESDTPYYGI